MYRILVLLLVVPALCLQTGSEKAAKTGSFNTADGSHCTWFDLRTSQTSAALATACICKDSNGRSQSYGCQYSGDLYTCDEFVANSREVIAEVVSQLSGN